MVGWGELYQYSGAATQLQEAAVPLVSGRLCGAGYSSQPGWQGWTPGPDRLCAGLGDTDTCAGDSGGPLLGHK